MNEKKCVAALFSTEAISISSPLIRLTALLDHTTLTRKDKFMFTHHKLLSSSEVRQFCLHVRPKIYKKQCTMYNNLDKHVKILNKSVGYYQEHVNYVLVTLIEKVSGAS